MKKFGLEHKEHKEHIKYLQTYLKFIRTLTGLGRSEFSKKIGVARQTLINIEEKKSKLRELPYQSILLFLHDYIEDHADSNNSRIISDMLFCIFFDNSLYFGDDEKVIEAARTMTTEERLFAFTYAVSGGALMQRCGIELPTNEPHRTYLEIIESLEKEIGIMSIESDKIIDVVMCKA